jgi:adenylosuccinate synthase
LQEIASSSARVEVRSPAQDLAACPLVLPYHVALDQAREGAMGDAKIGTTGAASVRPTKTRSPGRAIRVQDLLYPGSVSRRSSRRCSNSTTSC